MLDKSVLFLGKKDDIYCEQAAEFVGRNFSQYGTDFLTKSDGESELWYLSNWDYIISYLCPLVISSNLLSKARIAAINFHPGPPEYPGIGCTNFAIYDGVDRYGVTCHHMESEVDAGGIIDVDYFSILPNDTVHSLTERCYVAILRQFYKVMEWVIRGGTLTAGDKKWLKKATTRVEFEKLCRLDTSMSLVEIDKRIKACTYPGYKGTCVELYGKKFYQEEG